ncbi:hypothetical protein SCACP_24010 [Sporomusa carbonis]
MHVAKSMTITYKIGTALYINITNITNRCTNNCVFLCKEQFDL